jgi:C-terminal processing protease CtpA/Prc
MPRKCSYLVPMSATPWSIGLGACVFLLGIACSGPVQGSVGAKLGKSNVDGRVFVREAPAGMAAARAGLLVSDEILAIDGKNVRTMSPDDVHAALSGPVGSFVTLTVKREGEAPFEVKVERGPLEPTPD